MPQGAEKAQAEAGDDAALLFETHQMMAESLDYVDAIEALVKGGLNAEAADDTEKQFSALFDAMDDEYMRARSADVLDVSRRILNILQGVSESPLDDIDTPVILAAALISDCLAQVADFFSIGTNGLIQYALACDRQNTRVAEESGKLPAYLAHPAH